MRFVSFESGGSTRPGIVVDEGTIIDIQRAFGEAQGQGAIGAGVAVPASIIEVIAGGDEQMTACRTILELARAGKLASAAVGTGDVTLAAPIPRPAKNVFCVGLNYRAHITEGSRAQKKEDKVPDYPVFFTKPPTAVIGPGGAIRLDPAVSDKIDYEVEMGVVIGKAGRDIDAADAIDHIFGFTIINDITARDIQRRHGGQFFKGKGLDTSCPVGPVIVTIDELPNFADLRIALTVNGELRQESNTGSMIFPVPTLLESLSEGLTLEPGDLLASGTPSGVGYAMDPPNFLKHGDTVTCEIEGIGQLTNVIADVSKAA
jgi:2-keto-4-pentenoate hydratase/2-oxohepta-3-ene-1,7-dioic acid hydratase in catechol pathway